MIFATAFNFTTVDLFYFSNIYIGEIKRTFTVANKEYSVDTAPVCRNGNDSFYGDPFIIVGDLETAHTGAAFPVFIDQQYAVVALFAKGEIGASDLTLNQIFFAGFDFLCNILTQRKCACIVVF